MVNTVAINIKGVLAGLIIILSEDDCPVLFYKIEILAAVLLRKRSGGKTA